MVNSRQKGAAAEREVAQLFRSYGFKARRGQQFSGANGDPDVVVHPFPELHVEVKRRKRVSLDEAIATAKENDPARTPIIWHRDNHEPWKVTMNGDDFLEMLQRFTAPNGQRLSCSPAPVSTDQEFERLPLLKIEE